MTLKEIIKLESLKGIEIIAGNEGVERTVEWLYVAECFENPLESIGWLQGGELIFITGAKMNGDLAYIEKFIKGIKEVGAAGLLINTGVYIDKIPEAAKKIANELGIPLFIIPWHAKLIDISKEITNTIISAAMEETSLAHFLTNILYSEEKVNGDAVKKAAYFGYDLEGVCRVVVIDIDKFQLYLDENDIFEEEAITKFKIGFKNFVSNTLKTYGFNVPLIDRDDSIILFIKSEAKYIERIKRTFIQLQRLLSEKMNGLTVSIGIGNGYEDLTLMKKSLQEAERAIRYSKCYNKDNSIEIYDNIQLFKLLFNVENKYLESYYLDMLGPIITNDKKENESSYIQILEMYFQENCNITTTSEKLFLHRNTLKYKLNKIEELLNCDLRDFNFCARLKVALDIYKLIALSQRTRNI